MSESTHTRSADIWLKYVAIFGPLLAYCMGICTGAWGTYQAFKDDDRRIVFIESWKEKQEDFNKVVIQQIAKLQTVGESKR